MPLRLPNLDDRTYDDLLNDAIRHAESSSGWKPSHPGDPGRILLELFAYMSEAMIYRINRLPEKVYVELLRLIGVDQLPPVAAVTRLRFSLGQPAAVDVVLPENTRVGCQQAGPQFATLEDAKIPAGALEVLVPAIHAEWAEHKEVGTGRPDFRLTLPKAPVIAPAEGRLDLIVGVETKDEESGGSGTGCFHSEGRTYRIWREVENPAELHATLHAYVANRATGTISFAPAGSVPASSASASVVPPAGSSIIVRFRVGGGNSGNVPANALVKLIDVVGEGLKLEVANPEAASGGRDMESLEEALARGPRELHALQRAVTAQDFELLATRCSGQVHRAYAYAKRSLWQYAAPGTVEVVLVPQTSCNMESLTPEALRLGESQDVLQHIQQMLDKKKPLGSTCSVVWCRYKSVKACIALKVHQEENCEAVRQRIVRRLHQMISPLNRSDWTFGKPLATYDVYRAISKEAGVRTVDPVVLKVTQVPSRNVAFVNADEWQQNAWYAASGDSLFRSLNNGDGWEHVKQWPGEEVKAVKCFPKQNRVTAAVAGLVAVLSCSASGSDAALHLSRDCGESWTMVRRPDFAVNDIAWMEHNGRPCLLIATEKGLFVQGVQSSDEEWKPMLVDPGKQSLKVRSVVVATNQAGFSSIAVATPPDSGVYLSVDSGRTFKEIGLKQKVVQLLKVQHLDTQRYLWAGFAAIGNDPGEGCARWQLQESGQSAEGWRTFGQGWGAGSCTALDFMDGIVLASSSRRGVLHLNASKEPPAWTHPDVNCGLPIERLEEFHVVSSIAASSFKASRRHLLAATSMGIYRSQDDGRSYRNCSTSEFNDRVTLPPTWLFCSDSHEVVVEHERP